MYELRKLWRGQISPSERFINEGSPYWKVSRKHTNAMNAFLGMISPEARKLYEEAEQLALEMLRIDTEEAFIQGFRLSARLILDVLTDYQGSFYSLAEKQQIEK
ncbi:MAG: hypothetical protein IKU68_05215 [Oscillospiraceae bacterium]|nr:hypothetical protein [Oscillospiraceae bacterium]